MTIDIDFDEKRKAHSRLDRRSRQTCRNIEVVRNHRESASCPNQPRSPLDLRLRHTHGVEDIVESIGEEIFRFLKRRNGDAARTAHIPH